MYLDSNSSNLSYLDYVPQFLDKCGEHTYETGTVITGWKDGLQINVSEKKVKVAKGSLGKFYLNDNFQTLRRGDTQRAIEKLSDELHLPMNNAKVTRIDLGQTMSMSYPEEVYYKYLGIAPYFQRKEQPNGIYYDNGNSTLSFYGKVKEQKNKGLLIPPMYNDMNLLRYEFRLKKRIAKSLRMSLVNASHLYEEDFYIELLEIWKKKYFSISKISMKMDNLKVTGSTKDLMNQLAFIGLIEIGYLHAYSKVREWQTMGIIDKKQASDIRKKLKSVNGLKVTSDTNDLINELDEKIIESISYFR